MVTRLGDLAFIDDREDELEAAIEVLRERRLYTPVGVRGWFESRLPAVQDYHDEVASVWAWIAHGLGYLELSRCLTEDEHRAAGRFAGEVIREDATSITVVERLGEPSLRIGYPTRHVDVYATAVAGASWVCFDYEGVWTDGKPPETVFLRDTRTISAQGPPDRVRLTPKGRELAGSGE